MKVSFITTVLNEEKGIGPLLMSLLDQTQPPDEIIITDAGSTDATVKIIKQLQKKNPIIQLIESPKAFRSQGRNLAISQAKNRVIAVSDSGNVLDKNWLKLISEPFKNKSVESVAGFYQAAGETLFQKCCAPFLATMPDQFDPQTYLPASRSVAFTKKAWEKVAGYPEQLNTCEDLVFASRLKQKTMMVVRPQALAYWQPSHSLKEFFQAVKNHAIGDMIAGYWPHLRKIAGVFLRYSCFYFFPPLFIAYLFWPLIKFSRYLNQPLTYFLFPLLQVTSDLAVMRGSLAGLKQRLRNG